MSLVIKAPAPTRESSPIVLPGKIVALTPTLAPFFIMTPLKCLKRSLVLPTKLSLEVATQGATNTRSSIENKCDIGKYVKLETNVYITAYSRIEDRVFVAPCVATSNDNFVGRTKERFKHFKGVIMKKGARVGVNATILPGKTIGEDSLVGAGALITSDTPPKKIVVGVPGKPLRDVPEEQLLENQGWEDE